MNQSKGGVDETVCARADRGFSVQSLFSRWWRKHQREFDIALQIDYAETPKQARPPSVLLKRRNEQQRNHFRCGRFFNVGHEWYVANREGRDLGPFAERDDAELALARHVAEICFASHQDLGAMNADLDRRATDFEVLVNEILNCWEHKHLRSENSAYVWLRQRLGSLKRHSTLQHRPYMQSKILRSLLEELDKGGRWPKDGRSLDPWAAYRQT